MQSEKETLSFKEDSDLRAQLEELQNARAVMTNETITAFVEEPRQLLELCRQAERPFDWNPEAKLEALRKKVVECRREAQLKVEQLLQEKERSWQEALDHAELDRRKRAEERLSLALDAVRLFESTGALPAILLAVTKLEEVLISPAGEIESRQKLLVEAARCGLGFWTKLDEGGHLLLEDEQALCVLDELYHLLTLAKNAEPLLMALRKVLEIGATGDIRSWRELLPSSGGGFASRVFRLCWEREIPSQTVSAAAELTLQRLVRDSAFLFEKQPELISNLDFFARRAAELPSLAEPLARRAEIIAESLFAEPLRRVEVSLLNFEKLGNERGRINFVNGGRGFEKAFGTRLVPALLRAIGELGELPELDCVALRPELALCAQMLCKRLERAFVALARYCVGEQLPELAGEGTVLFDGLRTAAEQLGKRFPSEQQAIATELLIRVVEEGQKRFRNALGEALRELKQSPATQRVWARVSVAPQLVDLLTVPDAPAP